MAALFAFTSHAVAQAPAIAGQSRSRSIRAGESCQLQVDATGGGPLQFQWYVGRAGDISQPLAGQTAATLNVSAPQESESYWVRVSNASGSVDSAPIRVLPWISRTSPFGDADLGAASYANGRFFIVAHERIGSSANGINWTTGPGGLSPFGPSRITYGNGMFVAGGGSTGGWISVSADGGAWTGRPTLQRMTVQRAIYNGTTFLAMGESQLSHSSDGLNWTLAPDLPGAMRDFAVGGGRHVAVGWSGKTLVSANGVTWTPGGTAATTSLQVVAFGSGRFVAIGSVFGGPAEIWVSTDGLAWTAKEVPVLPGGSALPMSGATAITYGGGVFVAVIGRHLLMSEDGLEWALTPEFFPAGVVNYNSVAYGNGGFLAAGEDGTLLQSSPIAAAPRITNHSPDTHVLANQGTSLSVAATGPGLQYQWYLGASGDTSRPISGATGASLDTGALAQTGTYWVRIRNATEYTDTREIVVRVATAPTIATIGPTHVECVAGEPVTFATTVAADPAPQLQWYRGGVGDLTNPVAGATSAALTITAGDTAGAYWLRATNMAGAAEAGYKYTPWSRTMPQPYLTSIRQLGPAWAGVGGNDIYISNDARSWTKAGSAVNAYLRDIAQGAGLYVAVGERGFFTSTDLQTWTQRSADAGVSIARGNGVFVVAGSSSVSANGVNWASIALPAGVGLRSVVFDGTQFVAVGAIGWDPGVPGIIMRSTDGVSWTQLTTPQGAALDQVAFVGGKYIATSSEAYVVFVSDDLATWTRIEPGLSTGRMRSIEFAFGRYFIGTSSNRYLVSSDARNWSITAGPPRMSAEVLRLAGTNLIASSAARGIFVSTDGSHWAGSGYPGDGFAHVAFGQGRYIGTTNDNVYLSSDGVDWQFATSLVRNPVAAAFGRFYSVSGNGELLSSDDGERWSAQSFAGVTISKVIAAGPRLFAFSPEGFRISPDGRAWTSVTSSLDDSVQSIAHGGGVYVAAAGTALYYSTNGLSWVPVTLPFGTYMGDVVYGGGKFVAVGSKLMTSADGQNWLTPQLPANLSSGFTSVGYASGRFFAAHSQGLVYSIDEQNWAAAQGQFSGLGKMTSENGRVLATGLWRRALDGLATSITETSPVQVVAPGNTATLRAKSAGVNVVYQWYQGASGDTSRPIAGAAGETYTTPPLSAAQSFWARASGAGGVVDSATMRVLVSTGPVITRQPSSGDLIEYFGFVDAAELKVEACGTRALSYQWYIGRRGDTLHPVPGGAGPLLVVPPSSTTARYWVRVSDDRGQMDSAEALVTSWSRLLLPGGDRQYYGTAGLAALPGKFVVTGLALGPSAESRIQTSTNGAVWTGSYGMNLGSVIAGDGQFIGAPLTSAAYVYLSTNGVSWTEAAPGIGTVLDVFYGGGRCFVLTNSGTIASSSDGGRTWTTRTLATKQVHAIAAGNGIHVATGADGTVFRSSDGINWAAATSPTASTIRCAAYGAGKFLIVSDDGDVFASSDGTSWSQMPIETTAGWRTLPKLRRLDYVNERFFAALQWGSEALTSHDGLVWWRVPSLAALAFEGGSYAGINRTVHGDPLTGSISASSGGAFFRSVPEPAVPVVAEHPVGGEIIAGNAFTLSVTTTSATAATFQWRKDGVAIPGATQATFMLPSPQPSDSGSYAVVITNAAGAVMSRPAVLTVKPNIPPGLASGLAHAQTGGATAGGAFTIEGTEPKQVLVRALGPALAAVGISGHLDDPRISIVSTANEAEFAANDDWSSAANAAQVAAVSAQVGASPLASGGKDAAVLATFPPGTYRIAVGPAGASGVTSLEIYEADTKPRLVYLATRGHVGAGGVLTQAVSLSAAPQGRSYLIRALGPSTGEAGALADPRLAIHAGSTLLAGNDNWAGDPELAALGTNVGAMPIPATSRDAALKFVPAATGAYTIQVAGVGGTTGNTLLEIFECDPQRAADVPLALISMPAHATANAGEAAAFGVVTIGRPAPTFQWKKDGVALPGANTPSFALQAVQLADAGNYSVTIQTGVGSSYTASATLTVNVINNARQVVLGDGYHAGGVVTISNSLHYAAPATDLAWKVELPSGWSFAGDSGSAGDVKPAPGATGTLQWSWSTAPASPVTFSYTVNVPSTETSTRSLAASARVNGSWFSAAPAPLPIVPVTGFHSADSNRDGSIGLLELTRMIELYNTRHGPVRTGAYRLDDSTEDGFAAEPLRAGGAVALLRNHSADTDRSGSIGLAELTRVIQLYNHRVGSLRTGEYHAQSGTEDGFAPGR